MGIQRYASMEELKASGHPDLSPEQIADVEERMAKADEVRGTLPRAERRRLGDRNPRRHKRMRLAR